MGKDKVRFIPDFRIGVRGCDRAAHQREAGQIIEIISDVNDVIRIDHFRREATGLLAVFREKSADKRDLVLHGTERGTSAYGTAVDAVIEIDRVNNTAPIDIDL